MIAFYEMRKPEYSGRENLLGAEKKANNKLNPSTPGIESRPLWVEASAFATSHKRSLNPTTLPPEHLATKQLVTS